MKLDHCTAAEIADELIDRMVHSNGGEFCGLDKLVALRDLINQEITARSVDLTTAVKEPT